MYENQSSKQLADRYAQLKAWEALESDPTKRGELAELVKDAREQMHKAGEREQAEAKAQGEAEAKAKAEQEAKEKADQDAKRKADQEKADKEAKAKEEARKAAEKREQQEREKAELEAREKELEAAKEQGRDEGKELSRERVIEVPQHIKELPDYETTLARIREQTAQEMARYYMAMAAEARVEAALARQEAAEAKAEHLAMQDPTRPGVETEHRQAEKEEQERAAAIEAAANELDAKLVEPGQEVEGEVLEVAQVNGQSLYVVEQDGERYAVPAGEKPEFEKGDEITVERSEDGRSYEASESYSYGR